MRTIFLLVSGLWILGGCAGVENRTADAFGWQELYAEGDPDSARVMGLTDRKKFLQEILDFPWRDQSLKANELREVSPTLSVEDLLTDHTFFVSSGCADDGSDFGYYAGFVYPQQRKNVLGVTRTHRQVDLYLIDDLWPRQTLIELIDLFFERDHDALQQKLSGYPLMLQTPERITWKQYLVGKQAYFQK